MTKFALFLSAQRIEPTVEMFKRAQIRRGLTIFARNEAARRFHRLLTVVALSTLLHIEPA